MRGTSLSLSLFCCSFLGFFSLGCLSFFKSIFIRFFHFCHLSFNCLFFCKSFLELLSRLFIFLSDNLSRSSCAFKFLFKSSILRFKFSYKFILWIFVNNSLIFNLFGSISIFQCIDCFIKVFSSWSNRTNHVSL